MQQEHKTFVTTEDKDQGPGGRGWDQVLGGPPGGAAGTAVPKSLASGAFSSSCYGSAPWVSRVGRSQPLIIRVKRL